MISVTFMKSAMQACMASCAGMGRSAGRAFGRARGEVARRGSELARRTREAAHDARVRIDRSRAQAGPEGWRPARIAAGAAGAFLVWRALFGRGLARIPAGLAGLVVLSSVFPDVLRGRRRVRAEQAAGEPRRTPEVIEVKSPAEMEQGIASATPTPTFPDRVDRGPGVEPPPRGDRG